MIKRYSGCQAGASFPRVIILCLFLFVFILLGGVMTQSSSASSAEGNNFSANKPHSISQNVAYIPNMIYERRTFTPIVHNNILYAIGGKSSITPDPPVEVYNMSTNSWAVGPSANQPTGICACVKYNGWICSFQGTTVKALDVTKTLTQQIIDGWQTITTSNVDVQEPYGAVVIGNKAYLTGIYSLNLYFYDFTTGNGGVESSLPVSRTMGFGLCALEKVVYILGGTTNGSHNFMAYNTVTKDWTSMPSCGSYNSRAVSYYGKVYEVGGGGSLTGYCGNEITEISPKDGSYVAYDTMAELRGEMGAVVAGNWLYVLGGYKSNGTVSKSMEIIPLPKLPVADVKANGSDGPITISRVDLLSLYISLSPGDYAGVQADWWLLALTPKGWYHFDMSSGWLPGKNVTRQGNIRNVPLYPVSQTSGLPAGSYIFIFGVDFLVDDVVNSNQAEYDYVKVKIIS